MRLYYAPGACSMAPHIVLREAGYSFELARVDLGKRHTADGEDHAKINPDGYVPAFQLHDGQIRAEAAVIVQILADHKPAARPAVQSGHHAGVEEQSAEHTRGTFRLSSKASRRNAVLDGRSRYDCGCRSIHAAELTPLSAR